MSAAAVIILRRKRLVRCFRKAGATDQAHAVTLESLGVRRTRVFDQMLSQGVFWAAGERRFYLNERAAAEFFRRQRQRAIRLVAPLAMLFLLLWLLGVFGK